jgi:hypothetical protein
MRTSIRLPVVTIILIAASVAVALFSSLGSSETALRMLFIADPASEGFQNVMAG